MKVETCKVCHHQRIESTLNSIPCECEYNKQMKTNQYYIDFRSKALEARIHYLEQMIENLKAELQNTKANVSYD